VPLYFAYGSNIDTVAMAQRCPRSIAIGPARFVRHRLAVMREGWLTVLRDPHATVYGVLWDLALSDVPALDRYEGVGVGLYRKALQSVATDKGAKRALVYFGANAGPGVAAADYIETIIAAARQWNLPIAPFEAFRSSGSATTGGPAKSNCVRPRFTTPFDR